MHESTSIRPGLSCKHHPLHKCIYSRIIKCANSIITRYIIISRVCMLALPSDKCLINHLHFYIKIYTAPFIRLSTIPIMQRTILGVDIDN